ncbi:MAG: hypothetical protein LBG48_05200 [Rickettsiales bacterium]|nr:hypothetical protein [Rickettsiales bacterium]
MLHYRGVSLLLYLSVIVELVTQTRQSYLCHQVSCEQKLFMRNVLF